MAIMDLQIVFDLLVRRWGRVARNFVGAGENDDNSRFERNHVLLKADQHLQCGLTAIPSLTNGFPGKNTLFSRRPQASDGIA